MSDEELTTIKAQMKWMAPLMRELEPVARREQQEGLIRGLEADGNIVKQTKGMATSATLQASVTAVITGLFAAWSAYEAGNLEAAGAALGAAVTAAIAIWGRLRVGDLK
jgi:hypothetical protein